MHLLSVDQLDKNYIEKLFNIHKIPMDREFYDKPLKGKTIVTFFAEPSTRTRLSFESAMYAMGGNVISVADGDTSSLKKGESLKDTFRTLSQYADLIVFRHSNPDWPEIAQKYSRVPVINAGNGNREHPTQALLDLYTIYKELGSMEGHKILFTGDLENSRTIHSLLKLLPNNEIYLAPTYIVFGTGQTVHHLSLPNNYKSENYKTVLTHEIPNLLPEMDIVYMTRLQKERMTLYHPEVYNFCMTNDLAQTMKTKSAILHPLPRLTEIDENVDDNHRAAYHERQIKNGVMIRQMLLYNMIA